MERVLGRQFPHLLTNSLLLAPSWPRVRKFSRRLPRVRARYTAAVAITSGRAGCLEETLAYSSTCSRGPPRTPRVPVAAANPKRNSSSRAGADAIPASWRLGPPAARVAPSGCTAPRSTDGRQAAPAYGATPAPRGHALGSSGEGRYCASRGGQPRLPSASPPEARRYPDCCDC